jgi:UDP-N-acetylmuramoyl-L-alanyl-D-glutamate--2,6-diaminopimelate ligase
MYKNPSKNINVIAITGTKGKSSTTEFVNAVLEEAGFKTAILSTIRFKIGDHSRENLYKMTMPGRFFVQKFLREAVDNKCDFAIIEMTSEGARFFRHKWVDINTLIFTNLSPEHIESHGSFNNYLKAKLRLAQAVKDSSKKNRSVIANGEDKHAAKFLIHDIENNIKFYKEDASHLQLKLPGEFNMSNAAAAVALGRHLGIPEAKIKKGIESLTLIPGRAQEIDLGQKFKVVIDYAHTKESLQKIYEAYPEKKIAVLGSTGGGRDKWKRKAFGEIADEYCYKVIVTDEDPYDDDPMEIINDVAEGVTSKEPLKILSRREAIAEAIKSAKRGDAIIISGKGTDPYIMRAGGAKEPWSDAQVAREEIEKYLKQAQDKKEARKLEKMERLENSKEE